MSIQLQQETTATSNGKLGSKRCCGGCGTKFYDMNKREISCPKCEAPYVAASVGADNLHLGPVATKPRKGEDVLHHMDAAYEVEDLADVGGDLIGATERDEHDYERMIGSRNHLFDSVEDHERY